MKSYLSLLALALAIVCMQSASAQTFKKVKVSNNTPLVQVASGGASVWALASNGHPYILKGKSFALANSISLSQIAVGGGSALQADEVWGLNSSGNVFRASKSGASWVFTQVAPASLDLIVVGPGYQDSCHPYEVWGLDSSSQIFRYNFCVNTFAQEPGTLCDIHTGGGDVWGADCGPHVFRFSFSTDSFGQVASFGSFPAITVGPNGVWVVDTAISADYQYEDFDSIFLSFGTGLTQIQAGGNGVWALDPAGSVFRLTASSPVFVPVPGVSFVSLSVGSGAGVWGINSSHQVFAFSTP